MKKGAPYAGRPFFVAKAQKTETPHLAVRRFPAGGWGWAGRPPGRFRVVGTFPFNRLDKGNIANPGRLENRKFTRSVLLLVLLVLSPYLRLLKIKF